MKDLFFCERIARRHLRRRDRRSRRCRVGLNGLAKRIATETVTVDAPASIPFVLLRNRAAYRARITTGTLNGRARYGNCATCTYARCSLLPRARMREFIMSRESETDSLIGIYGSMLILRERYSADGILICFIATR